jgi:plastocyanin
MVAEEWKAHFAALAQPPEGRRKATGKEQKAKGKRVEQESLDLDSPPAIAPTPARAFAFCLLLFAFCLFFGGTAEAAELTGTVVDTNGNPLADAVVFVDQLPEGAAPPPAEKTAVMDQVNKQFVPRVLPVAVGTAVSFPNHDQIHHHVYSFSKPKTFEIPLYKGEVASPVVFDHAGAVTLGCNIHEWMRGIILVLPTALFAVTDARGNFTLRDVPDGTCRVSAWHEGAKAAPDASAQTVAVGAATAPLRFTLAVAPRKAASGGGGLRGAE